jgi:hypothetical protein
MSAIKIFSDDDFYVYDFLLSNEDAADIIIDSLFKGMPWYQCISDSPMDVYLYCSDMPSLVDRIRCVNNNKTLENDTLTIKLILFAIDTRIGNVISIGSCIKLNHDELVLDNSFSLSNNNVSYMFDSFKYNITLYELEAFNECVGQSRMINRFTVPYGFIDSNPSNIDPCRYNGSLLSLRTLKFTSVSWLADVQCGEFYNTLSLYISTK